jgi:radical SAM superfamily enzyme YgiQ (UPF0313 family)
MGASSILFAHVPWRRGDERGSIRRRIMAIPTGMFGLAALARRAGWTSSMLHVGIEELLDPSYRLERDVAELGARVVAFDLQWHAQLSDVLEATERVKRACPDVAVLLGGITASWFHQEILEHCPWVDWVIRGDAERPLERLLAELEQPAPELGAVPNLSWRRGRVIAHNAGHWLATSADLDAVEIDVGLLRHHAHYDGAIEHPTPPGVREPLWGNPRCFHVVVGRGCSRSCAYCGGALPAQSKSFGRKSVVLKSAERVETELRTLVRAGFHTLYFAFDPPGTTPWYVDLFERVARGGPLPGAVLEQYDGLPSDELLRSMSRAFGERRIALSPGSALPALRARHGLFNPENAAIEDAIRRSQDAGAEVLLYFTLFPDDTVDTLSRTAAWMAELQRRHGVDLQFVTIEVEPGAAWLEDPSRYGVELERRSFGDFLRHHRNGDPHDLGYRIRDEAEKRRILSDLVQPLLTPRPRSAEPRPEAPC